MPSMPALEISPDMRWGDLIDVLSEPEQACISDELGGDLLATVRETPLINPNQTQDWETSIFGCLSRETASELFLASFVAQLPGLPQESEECVRGLLMDVDITALVASQTPGADPAAEAAALQFGFGLLACLPPEMMTALMTETGTETPTDSGPAPTDDASIWRFATGGFVVNAPAVANGVVYVGSDDNNVYSLDAASGEMNWSFETGDVIRSTPTVVDGAVYVGSNDNHVYALDAASGEMLWKYDTGDSVQYSPVVSDGDGLRWRVRGWRLRRPRLGRNVR